MKTLAIRRSVPLYASWDVIVVGGGPAGCTAAAAAAREGARTLLLEATGALGGMGTQGLVPAWCPFSDKKGNLVYRGLAETVFREARKGVPHVPAEKLDWVSINPEQLKRVYDDLVTKHGADVLFHTFVAGVETSKGRITTLLAANKDGLGAYRARVYVDGTGDADLAAWAGARFHKGDDKTGELQPATHCFILTNVDPNGMENAWRSSGDLKKRVMKPVIASGKYPDIRDPHFCHNFIGPAAMGFNSGHLWDVDNTDPASVSRAMMKGRRIAAQFRDALAERLPAAFGNAFLAATGTLMGCRETRRIVGDYVLNMTDYLARRSFQDEICRNNYWIDIHTSKKEVARAARTADTEHVIKRFEHYGPGESHGIPYRCLTPKGLRNVLVAGRSISCDRPVQGSIRVMPTCLAMGEAAGMAAALAARKGDVRAVDVQRLRARLRQKGAFLL